MKNTPVTKLTREAVNAFPVRNKEMSTQQLRQLCVDFFRFSKQALWTCDHDVEYYCEENAEKRSMKAGQKFAGLPYIDRGMGNVYRILDYMYDDDQVFISKIINKKKFNHIYTPDLWRNFGADSASAAYVGWGRVVNSVKYYTPAMMVAANGYLPVGPYTYPADLPCLSADHRSWSICLENGEKTMFQSYAALQAADGLVTFSKSGHVMMSMAGPQMAYYADGTIDPDHSWVTITEQTKCLVERDTDGQQYTTITGLDEKRNFRYLYENGYLPFTFAEFTGAKPVEDTAWEFSHRGDTITLRELFRTKLTCNHSILDICATVTNEAGEEIYRHAVRPLQTPCREQYFSRYAKDEEYRNEVTIWGELPLPGNYHVEITAQIATGERPVIYNGALEVEPAVVTDPLTWDKINAFPIKYKGMPVAERRKLCADFFRFQKTVNWTPDDCLDYTKNPKGAPDKMFVGTVYRGFPYVTTGSGNVFRLMDFMDEKGYVDMKRIGNPARKLGNQCAAGCFGGWGRVVNSANYTFTANMTVVNGFQRVGPYTYDDDQPSYGYGYPTTYDIIEANGEQVMFRSYAAMEQAYGFVNYRTAGHVIMCTTPPVVVYKEDGTIDGDLSYLYTTDQAQTWLPGTEENGDHYLYKNTVHQKQTFRALAKDGYIPFTFPELTGEKDLEDTVVEIDLPGDTVTWQQVLDATVTANYGINDVYAVITDDAGKELYRRATRATMNDKRAIPLTLDPEADPNWIDTWGQLPESGTYNLAIIVQLYTGERPTIWTGKIILK